MAIKRSLKDKITQLESYLGVKFVSEDNKKVKQFIKIGEALVKYGDIFRKAVTNDNNKV